MKACIRSGKTKKKSESDNTNVVELCLARDTRNICVLLIVHAVISFRSVPRILGLLNREASLGFTWVPHFTSAINWTLRLGLGLLQRVIPIDIPWLAIIDHSIDIGTKKALVVLRVPLTALVSRGSAIRLEDCECVGLTISEQINGDTIATDLQKIFTQAGLPTAIIKDGDFTLHKGVSLWQDKQETTVPVIHDIGHAAANALKKEFEGNGAYQRFIAMTSHGAKCLRQTNLAFLIPPKLRGKGRFMSISTLGKWATKIIEVLATPVSRRPPSTLTKLREVLPGFQKLKRFIQCFSATTHVVARVLDILKNKGLNYGTAEQCSQLLSSLPRHSKTTTQLKSWLRNHLEIYTKLAEIHSAGLSLTVSSDIVESLFGNFKHIIERSPQADMNRSTLLIPALCGRLDAAVVTHALAQTRHHDLQAWEKANIPYTLRKKRQAFFAAFGRNQSQIPGSLPLKLAG